MRFIVDFSNAIHATPVLVCRRGLVHPFTVAKVEQTFLDSEGIDVIEGRSRAVVSGCSGMLFTVCAASTNASVYGVVMFVGFHGGSFVVAVSEN